MRTEHSEEPSTPSHTSKFSLVTINHCTHDHYAARFLFPGRSWAASTTEGLLVYSLDNDWLFDPLDLDFSNTPSAVKQKLKEKDYVTGNKCKSFAITLSH